MDDLMTWLRAQLDEDERVARGAADLAEAGEWDSSPEGHVHDPAYTGPGWRYLAVGPDHRSLDDIGVHIARWDPARVLADVDAKRQRIEHYLKIREYADPTKHPAMEYILAEGAVARSLKFDVLPYAERDGWREEWRP